jgi:hypothetical protein
MIAHRSGPITPSETESAKKNHIPEVVFEAFNELIAKHYRNGEARFKQEDVVKLVRSKHDTTSVSQMYLDHWFDVESSYEASGWKVEYDKPGFCETYPATWTFTKKKRR